MIVCIEFDYNVLRLYIGMKVTNQMSLFVCYCDIDLRMIVSSSSVSYFGI